MKSKGRKFTGSPNAGASIRIARAFLIEAKTNDKRGRLFRGTGRAACA